MVNADLERCGLFRPMGQGFAADAGGAPNFQTWKWVGAHALVTGQVTGTDPLRVEFRLWDVLQGPQIQGTAYTTSAANWRRIAHIIADVIYERLVGEKGYFDTRIVYVAATGRRGSQTKRLAIMDQDSANNRILTDGSWLVLTPRFNPARDQIAFMSYANNRPRVYLFDLAAAGRPRFGEFEGMSFAPRFSPDGRSCILSVTRGGGSDIFVVDAASHAAHRLTSSGSIDTSPCYSPDGSQIVFNSDRGGDQQLYVMGAGGGGARRISFGHGRYATPVWSPRGDLIAFTRLSGGTFAIGVDVAGRLRRAHPVGKLLGGRPDLCAERPGADVLPRDRRPAIRAAAAIRRAWCRSTSPASTNARCPRLRMHPILPGRH